MGTTIYNVSNRLPVTVTGTRVEKSSGGLVSAMEGLAGYDLHWIGWPGAEVEEARRREVSDILRREAGAAPVFLTAAEQAAFYEGFANASLWPMLHYMPLTMRYEAAWWDAYVAVNRKFADATLAAVTDGDLVWVHDYQLMLVPEMLRAARPGLRIGFFLHTPWPAYEVFRCQPRRGELLRGLLGADLIGFHTASYMRHFRTGTQRTLGAAAEITQVEHAGRIARLGVYPIGINYSKFEAELKGGAFAKKVEELRAASLGKRQVVSVERLDYTKGILHRLDAIELFLKAADDPGAVKFVFVSVPSREGVEEYQDLRAEIEKRVGRINGAYATLTNSPIRFIYGSVDFTELCALYAVADAALVTPLVDGMNLVAKEYVACQGVENEGVLILSEFAGAAEELVGAVLVNPYDPPAVAGAMRQALAMPAGERAARMTLMRERVRAADAAAWARAFIADLTAAPPAGSAGAGGATDLAEAGRIVADALRAGRRVALFLDYDGTLREIEATPAAAAPGRAVRDALAALGRVPGVDVAIVSGRTEADLAAFFPPGPAAPALVAEHGAAVRRAGRATFERLDAGADYSWMPAVRDLMRHYAATTPGSFVEEKPGGLVWHYRLVDEEFGAWKANHLAEELAALTAGAPVEVRKGRKIVEAAPATVSKGAAVRRLAGELGADLVVCAGDDATDETMCRLDLPNLVTVRVGRGPSAAAFRTASPAEFRAWLMSLATAAHVHHTGSP